MSRIGPTAPQSVAAPFGFLARGSAASAH